MEEEGCLADFDDVLEEALAGVDGFVVGGGVKGGADTLEAC